MQEYEEKKSEEVLERNTADEKAMCVRNKVRGHIAFFYLCRIYTGRQVFNKKTIQSIALKYQKQYNIIGKNLVLLFNTEKAKKPNLK